MQFMFSRKSGIVLAALLGVQLILPASGWALTGRDVALKADQVDTSRTSDMSMAMIIKRGDQQLVRFMAMKKKKFPDSEKQHIRFLEPGDIRNTAYLTWSYRDINKDDDMWVYMPAESLVRRISGGSKKGSFMRSDYANEDISRREVDKDTYTLLPDEALSGVDCHVLEAKAVFPEKTNYSKRIIWIDPPDKERGPRAVAINRIIHAYRQKAQDELLSEDDSLRHEVRKSDYQRLASKRGTMTENNQQELLDALLT